MLTKKECFEISWDEVGELIGKKLNQITGQTLSCEAKPDDLTYWGVSFRPQNLTRETINAICEAVYANEEETKDALPPDDEECVSDFGKAMAERLLSLQLGYTWTTSLATDQYLYLIGCE